MYIFLRILSNQRKWNSVCHIYVEYKKWNVATTKRKILKKLMVTSEEGEDRVRELRGTNSYA